MTGVWQQIGRIEPPSWSSVSLHCINEMLASNLLKAIRPNSLGGTSPPEWILGREALEGHFGQLCNANHMFSAPNWNWGFRLTEPQVTKGWQNFLCPKVAGHELASKRTSVFFQAVSLAAKRPAVELNISPGSLSVEAEHRVPTSNKSIDLLIRWRDQSDPECHCALVVELKFGHILTAGQLPAYKAYVEGEFVRGDTADRKSGFFVLSPRTRRSDQNKLRRNAGWSVAYWSGFLRAFDRLYTSQELPVDHAFNAFRRTVWQMKDEF